MTKPLTARQLAILTYLYEFARDNGYQPTYRAMCKHFGIKSPNGLKENLELIAIKGYVRMARHAAAIRFLLRPDGTPFTGFAEKSEISGNKSTVTLEEAVTVLV